TGERGGEAKEGGKPFYSYRNDLPAGEAKLPVSSKSTPGGEKDYFKPPEPAPKEDPKAEPPKTPDEGRKSTSQRGREEGKDKVKKEEDGGKSGEKKEAPDDKAPPAPEAQRKIIRTGEVEFEIDSFDAAVDKVIKIASEEKGYIGTVNSEKLP